MYVKVVALLLVWLMAVSVSGREVKRKVAICFYGKFGNLNTKTRKLPSEIEALYVSYTSQKKHLIDVVLGGLEGEKDQVELDMFAHSWEAKHTHVIDTFHELYGPWLTAYQHDEINSKLFPLQSMLVSMMRSLSLMFEYGLLSDDEKQHSRNVSSMSVSEALLRQPKAYDSEYDIVMLMRYDLFFRAPLRLLELDSSVFWVGASCLNPTFLREGPGEYLETLKYGRNNFMTYRLADEEKKKVYGPESHYGVHDEFFISSPANFLTFFKDEGNHSVHKINKANHGGSPHRFLGWRLKYLGWVDDETLQEVPGFVCHLHFDMARHCNVDINDPVSKGPFDLDTLQTCNVSTEVLFMKEEDHLSCEGFEEGRQKAKDIAAIFHHHNSSVNQTYQYNESEHLNQATTSMKPTNKQLRRRLTRRLNTN